MDNFSNRLNLLIKESSVRKKDLAEAIGLSPQQVTEMSKGRSGTTKPVVRAIAAYFNVREEWLETGTLPIYEEEQQSNAHYAKMVPVYGSVPAGWPNEHVDHVSEEVIDWVPVEGSAHGVGALRVEGHSMSPEIRDGMYVLYVQDYDIRPGDVIVATDEFNRAMVKQYAVRDGEPWLVSINPEYPNFKVNEHYRIVGRVFQKLEKTKIGRGR